MLIGEFGSIGTVFACSLPPAGIQWVAQPQPQSFAEAWENRCKGGTIPAGAFPEGGGGFQLSAEVRQSVQGQGDCQAGHENAADFEEYAAVFAKEPKEDPAGPSVH